jgi:hypothetical protein
MISTVPNTDVYSVRNIDIWPYFLGFFVFIDICPYFAYCVVIVGFFPSQIYSLLYSGAISKYVIRKHLALFSALYYTSN